MIEHLLEMARKVSDQAEVFSVNSRGDSVLFENARLKDINSSIQSGVSLRIIKDNKVGFAYTRNLVHKNELIQNALDSLKGRVEGPFQLPLTKDLPALDTYDPSIEAMTNSDMIEECQIMCALLAQKTQGQINVSAYRSMSSRRIMNSFGIDLSLKSSSYASNTQILYPFTSASLHRTIVSKTIGKFPDEYMDYLVRTYNRSTKEVFPSGKKMKVLFLPETVYVLISRLQSATSGASLYQKISPLIGRIDEKLFDETLSVYNDPLDDSLPGARAFDDEGTPCRRFPIIENGVLKNYYYDLYFAWKLNAAPKGNGFRNSIYSKPHPSLAHLSISPGDASFLDLVHSIDCGIIIAGALGAHSGNIPYGDFSIGVSPALYVEKGEIAGHIKDVMVTGNIYDTLKSIIAIEDTLYPGSGGNFPSILLDSVKVTIKK